MSVPMASATQQMTRHAPRIHCEACGTSVAADTGHAQYCIHCDIYVCAGCGNSSMSRCQLCPAVTASGRREHGLSRRTARRADRRLREGAREAIARSARAPSDTDEAWADYALLTIKVASAEQAAAAALPRNPPTRRHSEPRSTELN